MAARVRTTAFLLAVAFLFATDSPAQEKPTADAPKYRNPALTAEERAVDLLPRLTLEEKIEQIAGGSQSHVEVLDTTGTYTTEQARAIFSRWWDPELQFPPKRAAILRNAVQRYLREKTKLGIPALFMGEGLHGFMEYGSTSFPQALGLASTWDPDLVHQVFTAAADEAASAGVSQVFSPVLDIARDPRWGRTEETYGEDPFLAARMGVAAITGFQGDTFNIDRHHVLATAKHFAVHGQPEGGTNTAPGNYSERILRENFLVPFQAAIQEAHAGSVMASYNEIDGIPSHINHWLLQKVLREEWGFRGFVTSDGDGIQMLVGTHHVAADNAMAARLALAAGVDFDLSDGAPFRSLVDQVKQGTVPESEVNQAVLRVLTTKFRLGLFDNPYVDPDYAEKITNSAEHRQLALKAAQKVAVLLKNDKNLLPLDLAKLKTIAVIGPNAEDVHLGGYSREPAHSVSILQGIRDRVGSKAQVVYAEGCKITDAKPGWRGWFSDNVHLIDPATQVDSIKAAAEAARKADVAILVVGENESTNREAWSEQHLGDRDSLDLWARRTIWSRPSSRPELQPSCCSSMGARSPSTTLPNTSRRLSRDGISDRKAAPLPPMSCSATSIPAASFPSHSRTPWAICPTSTITSRRPIAPTPSARASRLFPFGYGLSYTTFKFDNLRVEPEQILAGGTAHVSVDVTNTGTRDGDEVPQLYVHQKLASVTRPVMQLKGFQRITLKPGEKKTVSSPSHLTRFPCSTRTCIRWSSPAYLS